MVNKKGFLRTTESILAIAISFVFLIAFLPTNSVTQSSVGSEDILIPLRTNAAFRACVIAKNIACINSTLDARVENIFSFNFNLSTDPNVEITGLPDKQIVANSLFVAGNITQNQTIILRLFYWPR